MNPLNVPSAINLPTYADRESGGNAKSSEKTRPDRSKSADIQVSCFDNNDETVSVKYRCRPRSASYPGSMNLMGGNSWSNYLPFVSESKQAQSAAAVEEEKETIQEAPSVKAANQVKLKEKAPVNLVTLGDESEPIDFSQHECPFSIKPIASLILEDCSKNKIALVLRLNTRNNSGNQNMNYQHFVMASDFSRWIQTDLGTQQGNGVFNPKNRGNIVAIEGVLLRDCLHNIVTRA